jgi:quinol monooxygenase YgiN
MIIVWGSIVAGPGCLDSLIGVSLEHVHRSRLEPGCLKHSVQVDVENPERLVFYEEWSDMEALQVHFAVPASGEFVTRARQFSIGDPEIKIYEGNPV